MDIHTRIGPAEQTVLDAIADGCTRATEIASRRRASVAATNGNLNTLLRKGLIRRVSRGVYALAAEAPPRAPEPVPPPEPEPALPPVAEHAELVPVDAAPPGRTTTRLVQILSRLTSEDLEESADWYTAAIQQLEHERNLITQAIEAKAA